MSGGEFDLIRAIRAGTPPHPGVLVGPGDDCAVLRASTKPTLITTDVLTEGVDFILSECGPQAVGRKAMAVNLSDIAAMGGRATAAVVGVVLPQANPGRKAGGCEPPAAGTRGPCGPGSPIMDGLREVADAFGVAVVGGDTNSWAGGLVVSVTVLGEPIRGPVLRSGANADDWIFVTGPLGGSLLGRHLHPTPRLREAEALVTRFPLSAMIDVSDGLAADLNHICVESGIGAALDADDIPVHPDAVERSKQTGTPPLWHALSDGEDFELVFTLNPADGARLLANPPVPVWKIGTMTSERGLWLFKDGVIEVLSPVGWQHAL